MTQKKDRVEELLKQAETTKHKALKSALERHAEEEQKYQERRLVQQFGQATDYLEEVVDRLKEIRKQEKAAKADVLVVDKAFEQFKTDGDFDKFRIAIAKAGLRF
jgi:uncharacterized protein involved in exopolysaccharide biosynthesis